MKTVIAVIAVSMSLQGCAIFGWDSITPIEVRKKAQERTPLNLVDPAPLKPRVPNWIVITPENQAQVWAELKAQNTDQVLFALTDDGYEELSINTAEQRNFIAQLRDLLRRYRDYYEPKKAEDQR